MRTDALTLTVSELNALVRDRLESDLRFASLCVLGELSNYKIYPSGHHYFTLKDQESSLRCVMFRSSAVKLRFRPENGMQVCALGSLRVYHRDGAYQLYCSGLIPEGIGDLQLAFEQLKQKLLKEGLFDSGHKKPLPAFPARIALITSPAGAAVHDMIRILGRRWPLAEVLVVPVRVQGAEAPGEIAEAIRRVNAMETIDLIITGRGGGSLEDLWAFNDEQVARAVYASRIPVISAVGHEPDVTICDFVADRRAATPSNAAEIAVPDREEIADALNGLGLRLRQGMDRVLREKRRRLELSASRTVLRDAAAFTELRRLELDRLGERLSSAGVRQLTGKRNRLTGAAASLDALSPLKVLARGYAIASDREGSPICSVRRLQPGDRISLRLRDGSAECTVEKREEQSLGTQKALL
ncbi:MAG: exodeoxyribonuclease VII large subunit [Oscillospiraceae bacterium]|nr:exodeoxyribonuclease VII large subunit [Oscillospiraceae bacterium]